MFRIDLLWLLNAKQIITIIYPQNKPNKRLTNISEEPFEASWFYSLRPA